MNKLLRKLTAVVASAAVVTVGGIIGLSALAQSDGLQSDGLQTTLDVSQGSITITDTSVSGKDGSGTEVTTVDPDGYVITGTTTENTITVSGTQNIVLDRVNIDVSEKNYTCAFKIEDNNTGTVTVTLADDSVNTLKSGYNCAGLQKNGVGAGIGKLIIKGGANGTGKLTATSGYYGAGIGSGYSAGASDITISGGIVTATGFIYGPGIGSGEGGSASDITISGGTVTAKGGTQGAGIGCSKGGSASDITISGGTVTAKGGSRGAGIGGGYSAGASDITISGGIVSVKGGNYGAGIGGGYSAGASDITISGGIVTAEGGIDAAGIGGGSGGSGTNITISGGSVKAVGYLNANDIGGGIGNSAVAPTLADGTTKVFLSQIDTAGVSSVAIDGVEYPTTHNGEAKIYPYFSEGFHTIVIDGTTKEAIYMSNEGSATSYSVGTVGAFEVYGGTLNTDYSYSGNVLTISGGTTPLMIKNTDPNAATTDKIEVASGISANITLAGINIDVSGTSDACAFKIADGSTGTVTITLASGSVNKLISGKNCAGLQKNGTSGYLEIKGTGALTATGGANAAGIGGGKCGDGSGITISGGTVTATGGDYGAGIGGGSGRSGSSIIGGSGTNITISGGTVTATGGENGAGIGGGTDGNCSDINISGGTVNAASTDYGAGIGGGKQGTAMNINISGGTVTATGGDTGAGIGGGNEGNGSVITISGGIVTATGVSGGAGIGGGTFGVGSGIIISGGSVLAQGGKFNEYSGAAIGNGIEVVDPESNIFSDGTYVTPTDGTENVYPLVVDNPNKQSVTVDGTPYFPTDHGDGKLYLYLTARSHTITVGEEVINVLWDSLIERLLKEDELGTDLTVTLTDGTGDPVYGVDYSYLKSEGVLTILSDTAMTIANRADVESTANTIVIAADINADITLAGVNINVSGTDNASAFKIADGSQGNVTVTLADGTENTLTSGNNCAGLQKNGDSADIGKLTITGTGSLTAIGGDGGAGIGGGNTESASNITISGGTVTATGGNMGAGIGGGNNRSGSNIIISGGTVIANGGDGGAGIGGGTGGSGSDITISGGSVTAKSNVGGAGIGGGESGKGSNITIRGGTVTATGGWDAAGIGSGNGVHEYNVSGSNITISGGTVTANGGDRGAGIGGGNYASGSNITISGGSVKAVAGSEANAIGGGKDGNGAVTPTNGTNEVYLLTIANPDGAEVLIDGVSYTPVNHKAVDSNDGNLYVYLPAKTVAAPNVVKVGTEETKYVYDTKWLIVPTVTAPTAKTGLVYNGTAQELISAGSTDVGTLLYSLDGTNYSEDIPTATKADSYTVYYKVQGNDNVSDVDAKTVSASIDKATPGGDINRNINVVRGVGTFTEPVFTGVDGQPLGGGVKYGERDYNQQVEELITLSSSRVFFPYEFTPNDWKNYNNVTGDISFYIYDVVFKVGNDDATAENAVTVKANPTYGDDWEDILTLNNGLKAVLFNSWNNALDDSEVTTGFSLDVTGSPNAGNDQEYNVLFTGTVGGKTYTNHVVATGTVDVAKKELTVSAGDFKVSKVYDGTTNAGAGNDGKFEISGLVGTDSVTITPTIGAFSSADIGTSNVTVTISLTDDSGNYTLGNTTVSVPAEITAKAITPTVEGSGTHTYTGSAITPNVTVKDGETVLEEDKDYTITVTNNINAGVATVTITAKSGGNYTFSERTLDFQIFKATPNVTAPTAKTGLVYNGTAQELITAGSTDFGTLLYSLDGTNYSEDIPTATDAGSYTVYYKVQGNANVNDAAAQTVSASIGKATPNVTAPTANTGLVYKGTAQELITAGSTDFGTLLYSLDGTTYSEDIPTATNADSYTVYYKVQGNANVNDAAAQTVSASIGKASVTVTAKNYTVKFGNPLPESLEYETDGLIGTDTLESIGANVTIGYGNDVIPSAIGNYIIVVSGAEKTKNYELNYVNGNLTIIAKNAQTITADDVTFTYGETGKKITATTSGDGAISYSTTSDVISVAADGTITALKAGTATVTITAAETADYAKAVKTVTVTVNKIKVAVPTADKTEYTYTGTAQTYGVTSTDDYTVEGGVQTNAGEYPITITLNNENYEWDGTLGTYKFVINKAAVTVTAKSYSIKVSETLPTYAYDVAGLVNGENLPIDVTISCNAADSNTAGTHTITVSGAANSTNYTFAYVNGTLTISNKLEQTITASDVTLTYGETGKKITATTSGDGAISYSTTSDVISVAADGTITALKAGTATVTINAAETDTYAAATKTVTVTVNKKKVAVPTADTTKYTYTGTAQTYGVTSTDDYTVEGGVQTNAGEYPITITLNNENYEWDGTLGTYKFVINKAAVTVTAKSYSIKVSETLPTYAYDVAGLVNGENLPIDVTISCNAADSNTAGTYTITVSGAANSTNYTFAYVNGTLTISNKLEQTITASDVTLTYGETGKKITATTSGDGAISYSTTSDVISVAADGTITALKAGTATVTINAAETDTYAAATKTVTVTVNKAAVTVTAKSYTIKVGEALPTYAYDVAGLVNGETLPIDVTISCNAADSNTAGTHTITVSGAANSTNYTFAYVNGTLTISNKLEQTITASDVTLTYGETGKKITATTNGNGAISYSTTSDVISVAADGTITALKAGTATVTINAAETDTYAAATKTVTVTVNKAAVTVTAKSYTIKVGETLPTYAYDVAGLVNGETLPIDVTISCNAADSNTAGTYDIIVSGAATSDNYTFSYVKGTLTVSEKEIVAAPTFTPASGTTFTSSQKVTISCATAGAKIYYTTDGTEPTTASTLYNGAFTITTTTTIKAIAVKDGMTDSTVVTATYTKKSSGGGGGGGYRPTTPTTTNPSISGSAKSWSDVAADLGKLTNGTEVTIQLNGNTTVPVEVIKAIDDRQLKVTFVVDSVKSWKTDGAEITAPAAADLSIIATSKLKTDVLRGISGYQFSTNNTNIPTDLEIAFKTSHAGKFANLYKSVDGKLAFVTCAKLGEDGKVILPDVAEKGDYVAMLCELSDRLGDMDNDGIMNAKDAAAILKDIVEIEPGKNPLMADFNVDGRINAMDAAAILKRIVGLA